MNLNFSKQHLLKYFILSSYEWKQQSFLENYIFLNQKYQQLKCVWFSGKDYPKPIVNHYDATAKNLARMKSFRATQQNTVKLTSGGSDVIMNMYKCVCHKFKHSLISFWSKQVLIKNTSSVIQFTSVNSAWTAFFCNFIFHQNFKTNYFKFL